MASTTGIEWTDATWNPIWGCSRVSEGCRNCYAEQIAGRFSGPEQLYEGLAHKIGKEWRWTGKLRLAENALMQPMHWKKPRRIFVNSMSDLFHEEVPDPWLDRVFATMAMCPQHTFQILTKRPFKMHKFMCRLINQPCDVGSIVDDLGGDWDQVSTPMKNVWLGVSVENQETADERIPILMQTPAVVRFISAEPLLGPINLRGQKLDWIICGGESGRNARPIHPDWATSLRDQCKNANIPFFFKQWGEWMPHRPVAGGNLGGDVRSGKVMIVHPTGQSDVEISIETGGYNTIPGSRYMKRVSKKHAGRLLEGQEWNQFP